MRKVFKGYWREIFAALAKKPQIFDATPTRYRISTVPECLAFRMSGAVAECLFDRGG
jgi:hypothetical protein